MNICAVGWGKWYSVSFSGTTARSPLTFWGIAAVAWVKVIYPRLSRLVEHFIGRKHWVFAAVITAFMVVDIALSAAALLRYNQRQNGDTAPTNVVEQFLDEHYNDTYLEHRYQNMKIAQQG